MLKKITVFAAAVLILVSSFGCGTKTGGGKKDPSKKTITPENKIALIIGSASINGDTFEMAKSLRSEYGDNLLVNSFSDSYLSDNLTVTTAAAELAGDNTVKAIVFGNGVEGTAHAVKRVRQLRGDMCIVVCNPVEDLSSISLDANIVLLPNHKETAESMVKNAAKMGAETFVFYTFQRHADYTFVKEMREIAKSTCGTEELNYVETFSIDPLADGSSEEIAKTFVGEDFYRKTKKYGENIAVYSTDPVIQEELVKVAAANGYIVAGTAELSPVSFANAFGADIKGHETDSKHILAAASDKISKSESKGKMASWEFSVPMMTLQAGFEYAYSFVNNRSDWIDNLETIDNIVGDIADGAPYSVKKHGEKIFLLGSDFYTY